LTPFRPDDAPPALVSPCLSRFAGLSSFRKNPRAKRPFPLGGRVEFPPANGAGSPLSPSTQRSPGRWYKFGVWENNGGFNLRGLPVDPPVGARPPLLFPDGKFKPYPPPHPDRFPPAQARLRKFLPMGAPWGEGPPWGPADLHNNLPFLLRSFSPFVPQGFFFLLSLL